MALGVGLPHVSAGCRIREWTRVAVTIQALTIVLFSISWEAVSVTLGRVLP